MADPKLMHHTFMALVGAGFVWTALTSQSTAEEPARPDMRHVIAAQLQARVPSARAADVTAGAHHDPELVTLPPFLVHAPVLKVPSATDTVRPVVGFVRSVNYTDYAARDEKLQTERHDLLRLADLAGISGDTAVAETIRKETYRALVRNPTPLERAMDRSVNGGRY